MNNRPVNTEQVNKTDRNWAMAAHLSGFSLILGIPFGNLLGPLIVWMLKKDRDDVPFAREHAKEALNFQLTFTLYLIGSAMLTYVLIGLILLPLVFITWVILMIRAGLKAGEGHPYRYPFTVRLLS